MSTMPLYKLQAGWGKRTKHIGNPGSRRGGLPGELWGSLEEDFLEWKGLEQSHLRAGVIRWREGSIGGQGWQELVPK